MLEVLAIRKTFAEEEDVKIVEPGPKARRPRSVANLKGVRAVRKVLPELPLGAKTDP